MTALFILSLDYSTTNPRPSSYGLRCSPTPKPAELRPHPRTWTSRSSFSGRDTYRRTLHGSPLHSIPRLSPRQQIRAPLHMGLGETPSLVPKFPHPRRKSHGFFSSGSQRSLNHADISSPADPRPSPYGPRHSLTHLASNRRNCTVRISASMG